MRQVRSEARCSHNANSHPGWALLSFSSPASQPLRACDTTTLSPRGMLAVWQAREEARPAGFKRKGTRSPHPLPQAATEKGESFFGNSAVHTVVRPHGSRAGLHIQRRPGATSA